jgi:hypothetical protein
MFCVDLCMLKNWCAPSGAYSPATDPGQTHHSCAQYARCSPSRIFCRCNTIDAPAMAIFHRFSPLLWFLQDRCPVHPSMSVRDHFPFDLFVHLFPFFRNLCFSHCVWFCLLFF